MDNPSGEYVDMICRIYGDSYDDREEDSRPQGESWRPGVKARHKSISAFQEELRDIYGIILSRAKIQKILISGGRWTTARSREIERLFNAYNTYGPREASRKLVGKIIRRIARELGLSTAAVSINLPYLKTVYELDEKSENAKRIDKCRENQRKETDRG